MTTLAELTTPLTVDEAKAAIYAALAARGVPITSWKAGGTARTIVAALSIVLAASSRLTAAIAASGFLELSEREWLTLVARHVYGVERNEGSFATGTVTLDNGGGGVYAGDPGDLVLLNTTTGKTYRNTAAFSVGSLETGVDVEVEAVELGTDSNALAGQIDDFVTPLLGVTVSNAAALIGADPESDEALRVRCREKTGTLSPNGPADAYAFIAKSAVSSTGSSIGVTRVLTVPDGVGGIDVYVADADGNVTGDAGDPATNLGAIAEAIHTQVEPLAITPVVQSATPYGVDVTYTLWVLDSSGYTSSEVASLVAARLADFISTLPIGGVVKTGQPGRVYQDALEAVIGGTLPSYLVDVSVTTPAADVDLVVPQAPVLGTVTPTIVFVPSGSS